MVPSPKQRLAAQLWSLADLVRAGATRREFRSRAYRQAVWSLDDVSANLEETTAGLQAVRGIGPGVARLISEFRENGEIDELTRLAARMPFEANRLRVLPRMTPTRLRWLKTERGIETVNDLIDAISLDRLGELKGVGPDTARTWLDRLEGMPTAGLNPPVAHSWAYRLRSHIEAHVDGAKVTVTGSVRRLEERVGEIEMVASDAESVVRFLEQSALVTGITVLADRVSFDTLGGIPLHLHTPKNETEAAAVFRSTGPGDHVAAVIGRIGDGGQLEGARTEIDIYRLAGLRYMPPPARSGDLEVPPGLIEVDHLRGDLHVHSDWSPDGRQTIEELVQGARSRGLAYIGITDHAKGLRFGGLDEERVGQQRQAIELIRPLYPEIVILQGSELNIDRDGEVDFDQGVLGRLDFAIAAVHSYFTLTREEQTRRVLTVISNPKVDVIAHLTGRRVGIRPPIDLDLDQVLAAAAQNGTALEANGHLDRMDISADIVGHAASLGALFAANSDAHRTDELSNVAYAVGILQRGRVSQSRVINAWRVEELLSWKGNRPGAVRPEAG